jgi:hypothetical protein
VFFAAGRGDHSVLCAADLNLSTWIPNATENEAQRRRIGV